MRTWIFQANPKIYDVSGAIRSLQEDTWLVQQHRDELRPGDRVYLWESGPDAGIVAVCEILDEVADRLPSEASTRFVLDRVKLGGVRPRVRIRISAVVDPRLSRRDLQAHQDLAELSILKQAQGTNFSVTPQQAGAIEELLAGRSSQ